MEGVGVREGAELAADGGDPERQDTSWGEAWCDLCEDPLEEGSPSLGGRNPLGSLDCKQFTHHMLNSTLPPLRNDELDGCRAQLREALGMLQRIGSPGAVDHTPDGEFQDSLEQLFKDRADFRPGRLQQHSQLWRMFFGATSRGVPSNSRRRLLKMLEEGIKLEFVGVDAPGQQLRPQRTKKLQAVTDMLGHAHPDRNPLDLLQGTHPHAVQFPNHSSAKDHSDFVTREIAECLRQGVIRRWEAKDSPMVVNGLRVVDNGKKLRLCINPMYINAFMRHRPLKYEQLQDLADYLRPEDFMYVTDDKSGYWQLSMHPSMYTYLAMEWEGQQYFWPHLAFGLAPACHIYTTLKQELFRAGREVGVRMSFLIDDQLGAAPSKEAAKFQCKAVVTLMAALGFTLSLTKCQLIPKQTAKFLGMLVHADRQAFEVPPDKVAALERLVVELSSEKGVTKRQLAQLAGRVVSMALAVSRAPLHSRMVARAMVGLEDWDTALPDPTVALGQAVLFLELLRAKNGKSSWRRGPCMVLRLVGDASDRAYTAFLPDGQLSEVMCAPFSPDEVDRMVRGIFSSTVRELGTLHHAIKWLQQQAPDLLQGKLLQYQTDSQAAAFCVMGMKGAGECLTLVAEIYRQCAAWDVEVEVAWYPRTVFNQRQADALSKFEDASQWLLNPRVYQDLLQRPELGGRRPALDCFADSFTTKVPGSFFSRHWCPGSCGVDAFAQGWAPPAEGEVPLWLINPPFDQMGRVIRKIQEERPDCLLVAPVWPRWWAAILRDLPVRAQWTLPHVHDLCIPGPQVPKAAARAPKAPRYRIQVLYICWDREAGRRGGPTRQPQGCT